MVHASALLARESSALPTRVPLDRVEGTSLSLAVCASETDAACLVHGAEVVERRGFVPRIRATVCGVCVTVQHSTAGGQYDVGAGEKRASRSVTDKMAECLVQW